MTDEFIFKSIIYSFEDILQVKIRKKHNVCQIVYCNILYTLDFEKIVVKKTT